MKQTKHILITFSLLLSSVAINAQKAGELINGLYCMFTFAEKTVEIVAPFSSTSRQYSGDIIIPSTVTRLGIDYNVIAIGEDAFSNSSITSIAIPESVKSIGGGAFKNCNSLTSVVIPESSPQLGTAVFEGCSNMKTVRIKKYIHHMKYSFRGCPGELILGDGSMINVSYPDGVYYPYDGSLFTKVTIEEGVTKLSGKLFYGCSRLTSVIIPASMADISSYAFEGCNNLTSITCKATIPPTIYGNPSTFSGVDKLIPIYVPAGSVVTYKKAEGWSEFVNILPLTNEYTLTVSSAGYATLYLDYAAEIPDDVKVYIATSVEGDRLMMTQVTGVLPANTGVIVRAKEGTYTFVESDDTPANVDGNLLSGTATDTYIAAESGYKYYVLAKKNDLVAMYHPKLNADGKFLNNANKAYLRLESDDLGIFDDETNTEDEGGQLSNRLRFDFGGTTDVEMTTGNGGQTTVIYDLQGRRVEKPTKPGIYIVNGQKVVF